MNTALSAADLSAQVNPAPTRIRYWVLAMLCLLSMITYLDRAAFGAALPSMKTSLGIADDQAFKWVFFAFAFAYAAFEIPSGWLGDVWGPRTVLIRIVIWWSFFTMLTALVGQTILGITVGLAALAIIRFLFGMGEAGAYPNIARALHNWLPFTERGLGQGAIWMCGRLMGGLTPLVWLFFTVTLGLSWRWTFCIFGLIGLAWVVFFAWWFRDRPDQVSVVNDAERQLIVTGRTDLGHDHANVPWRTIFTSGNLWLLCLMYFCQSYGWYFHITYLSSFLEKQFAVTPSSFWGGVAKGGPLLLGSVGCMLGGVLTDWYIRRTGDRRWGRKLFGIIGHAGASLCFIAVLNARNALEFALAAAFAGFFNDLTMGAAWATCQDIGRRYTAIVSGCLNMIGNLGGAIAGLATGLVLEQAAIVYATREGLTSTELTGAARDAASLLGYQWNFLSFVVIYAAAAALWYTVDATKPVVPEPATPKDQEAESLASLD